MLYRNLMMCVFILNAAVPTNLQVITNHKDRCSINVDNDLLLKMREMQLEHIAYRNHTMQLQLELIAYREQTMILQDRLSKMKQDYSAYRNESKESERQLQDRLSKVEHEYSAYRNESKESERRLQDRLSEMEQDYSAYRNESMESERRLQGQITQLIEEFAEYKAESMDNQTALKEELKRQDITIGFTAQLTSILSDYHNKPVIYDVVETNIGSGYNTTTGMFTAPVDGTYVFIWHVMTDTSILGYCWLYLYRNGVRLRFTARAESRGRTDGYDNASNSAVLTLYTGDTVDIKTYGGCFYLYGRPYTSFSGFKI